MTGRFTFVFTEKELSLLADATELAAMTGVNGSAFTRQDFSEMTARLDERLDY